MQGHLSESHDHAHLVLRIEFKIPAAHLPNCNPQVTAWPWAGVLMHRMGRNWGCFGFMILVGCWIHLWWRLHIEKKNADVGMTFTMTKFISYSCFVECVTFLCSDQKWWEWFWTQHFSYVLVRTSVCLSV